ncbi:MAG: ferredoxin reductase family protein [Desulfobacterales bacterium]
MNGTASGIALLGDLGSYRFRYSVMAAGIGAAALFLAGAVSIPFFFESPSIWYKFGFSKVLLRSGKMLGLAAAGLLFSQLLLAGRLKVLDRVFSLPRLVRIHRLNATVILLPALLHPILVLASEKKFIFPLAIRYWPEWVGVGLLALILIQFVLSRWRVALRLRFHRWLSWHRYSGAFILALVVLHLLFVSETFSEEGIPRSAAMVTMVLLAVAWLWIRSGWLRARKLPLAVTRVAPAGRDSTCIELSPMTERRFHYLPGQFVFVSFHSNHISREPHPFTLSSSPTRSQCLQVTVRAGGDWTAHIGRIAEGERAYLQGPFGRFSHMLTDPDREIVLIAGGIGITPMLSMLRCMADRHDQRAVTLVWSNRTREDMVYPDEFDGLAAQLTGLRLVLNFTRKPANGFAAGRIDAEKLKGMLAKCSRRAAVFVCGPDRMMQQVESDLKRIGFSSRLIFTETFGF